ncbi:hypothetical protein HYDPIDRAFT_65438, partial [Hydnomerulius pinastri MD-312]
MWQVKPELNQNHERLQSVEHLDVIFRGAHIIPVFGNGSLPDNFVFSYSLDAFKTFYVNKYADHHANEIAF